MTLPPPCPLLDLLLLELLLFALLRLALLVAWLLPLLLLAPHALSATRPLYTRR